MPDHVHKSGGRGGDQVQVGQWTDGKPGPVGKGTVGTWAITPGSKSVLLDRGKTHASKDFYDPVNKRHIMWVWGTVTSGIQTIPRHMTYHPGIKQIVYGPVAEMVQLRTKTLDSVSGKTLGNAQGVTIKAASAADIVITVAIPKAAATISVAIGGGSVVFEYTPATDEALASASPWLCGVGFKAAQGGKMVSSDQVPLLADDTELTMRVFLDGSVAEAYWMGGRVAMTIATLPVASVTITADAAATLANATSYAMGDIHTTKEAVLAAMH